MIASRAADFKLEAVSSRLKGELIHPNKSAGLSMIEFSPDGKRILAGDYPGGTIVLWDVVSGKLLTTIEAGYGYHATQYYYAVAPDWHTVFTWREKGKAEQTVQNGKRMLRWTYDGSVRAWDLETGKLRRTYKHEPLHNVRVMKLAPDGKTLFTYDEVPGTFEGRGKNAISLWDVPSGNSIVLDKLGSLGEYANVLSHDGKALAITSANESYTACTLKLIDVRSGQEKWSLPIREKNPWVNPRLFSRDDRLIFGTLQSLEQPRKYDKRRTWMKWWDAKAGHEVASFACNPEDAFDGFTLSPDGRTLAIRNRGGGKCQLLLYSVAEKRLMQTIPVGDKKEGYYFIGSWPAFSPDGKWLAMVISLYPEKSNPPRAEADPQDSPQPRISLIETATGTIRETLIAPQAFSSRACFSPDGRTLATDGLGRVLLWDLSKPPGEK